MSKPAVLEDDNMLKNNEIEVITKKRTFSLVFLALLLSFAVAIHTLEAAIPVPIPVPGVKLGLANIITILTLTLFGLRSGFTVAVLRSVLGSLLTGTFLGFGFILSISSSSLSTLAMGALLPLRRKGHISLISVSICGAVVFNVIQLTAAAIIVQNFMLWRGYMPFLLLAALPTGFFTGLAAAYLEQLTGRILRQQ